MAVRDLPRHVQRRWQLRDKVKPMDDMVAVVDAQEPAMNVLGIDAAEATSLLWEAAEGLGPAERELLSLVLTAQLDSGEVARVTGDKPDAVYVKVSRLKDGLGRAAGALLVARHHREDCAELDAAAARLGRAVLRAVAQADRPARRQLRDLRRVAEDRRRRAVRHRRRRRRSCALATLRERCVGGASSPDMVPVSFELGWPVAEPWERKRRGAVRAAGVRRGAPPPWWSSAWCWPRASRRTEPGRSAADPRAHDAGRDHASSAPADRAAHHGNADRGALGHGAAHDGQAGGEAVRSAARRRRPRPPHRPSRLPPGSRCH